MKAKQISKKKGASKATVTKGARKKGTRKKGTRKKGTRKSKPTTPVGDIMRNAAEVIRSVAERIRP
jgi:hypothetical protein